MELSILVFLPAVAGLVLCIVPKTRDAFARGIALAVSLVVLALSVALYVRFDPNQMGMQFAEVHNWIPAFHIQYKVGLDGISLAMVLLTAFLTPIAILASWKSIAKSPKGFFIAILFLETGMTGVFCAQDLFLFYVFWEAMLIPMYLLIGVWGGERRIYAAVKFFIYTMAGSLLMLAAILYVYAQAGTFDMAVLSQQLMMLPLTKEIPLFLAFSLAFAVKVPLFPFHTWLPDAHVEAPTAGSVILAGVLLKMGAYGFLRFSIPFFPDAAVLFAPAISIIALIGIVYGALMAMTQSDMKKLVAYSSVSHMGFVVLGIFSGQLLGIGGGVTQMINHGISTGALFLMVGMIYERTHKRGVDDFGGLAQVVPMYAAVFMIVVLSSIGLPAMNGFVGEFLILLGTFGANKWYAAVAALGVVLGAIYMLKLYRDTMFGPLTRTHYQGLKDMSSLEVGYMAPILIMVFVLGLAPNLILKKIEPSVRAVEQSFMQRSGIEGKR